MPTLFIPTRNRAHSLGNVLEYMRQFYPKIPIAIADGSDTDHIQDVEQTINRYAATLPVKFQHYDPELSVIKRMIHAIENINDEYIVAGADDDYSNMDVLSEGERFLRENPTYVTAMGTRVKIKYSSTDDMQLKLALVRPVDADNSERRMRLFSKWSFATTNAVTHKEHLLKRYDDMQRLLFSNAEDLNDYIGFMDYLVGNYDAARGKIKAYSDIGFISGYHYKHSRFRNTDKLFYLKKPNQIDAMQNYLIFLAKEYGSLSYEEARKLSEKLLRMRAAELSGARFHKMRQFENSKLFNHPVVQEQYGLVNESFELIQTKLSPESQEKLDFATKAMMNE